MIADLQKPDIVTVLGNEGLELRRKGKSLWARCPLHSEDTPSFKVDVERQSFYCFGCHNGGDVITFIETYKNLSFKDALRYLNITPGKLTAEARRQAEKEQRKRDLLADFRAWERMYHADLCRLYRTLQRAKMRVTTEADLDGIADLYHRESVWVWQMEILECHDDEAKFELYKQVMERGYII